MRGHIESQHLSCVCHDCSINNNNYYPLFISPTFIFAACGSRLVYYKAATTNIQFFNLNIKEQKLALTTTKQLLSKKEIKEGICPTLCVMQNEILVCYYYMLKLPKPGEAMDLETDKGILLTFDMKSGNCLQKFQKNGIQSGLSNYFHNM